MTFMSNQDRERASKLADALTGDELFATLCALEKAIKFDQGVSFGSSETLKKAFDDQIRRYEGLIAIVERAREFQNGRD